MYFYRERDFRTRSYLGPPGGGPGQIPRIVPAASPGEPWGGQNGGQKFDFTKKMDPSRSPVAADRSEISCYIGRPAVRPFLVPRGPKTTQKSSKNLILAQNPGGCRPENPSLYQPLGAGLLIFECPNNSRTSNGFKIEITGQHLAR